jgi:PAS domain S-box-containing protein
MRDEAKTKEQLLVELKSLRARVAELEVMETERRLGEEMFSKAFHMSPVPVSLSRLADGSFIDANQSFLQLFGYSRDEVIGHTSLELNLWVDPADRKGVMDALREYKFIQNLEICARKKSGELCSGSYSGELIEIGGEPCALNIFEDITGRKEREEALRESEERFRKLFEESPIAIELYDSKGDLLQVNKACVDMLGIVDMEEAKGLNIFKDLNLPEDAKKRMSRGETARYGHIFDFEKVKKQNLYRTTKSGFIYVDVKATPLGLKSDGTLKGYMLEIEDVTWRKRAEEKVHLLMEQLIKTQEAERQRLSRELHDSVAQDLFAVKIGLDTLFDEWPEAPPGIRQRIFTLSEAVKKTLKDVRDLSYDLRPPGLDHLGLEQSISQYCEEFSARTGIDVDFAAAGMDGLKLDFDTEIAIFRLIQEGLNNVKKHAGATKVVIRLVASSSTIFLRMEDDGKGFDVRARMASAFKEKRMGLQNMKERVGLLQGKMRIKSRRMQGTKVLIRIPYEGKHGEQENHPDR